MANQKEIRARISSTISTQQITKAMKLVSATKLRKASEAIIRMRPYAQKLQGIMGNLQESTDVLNWLDTLKIVKRNEYYYW
jgi:F-type H+-transporting ATPase subunit gamma